jgi:hypothetical protein
MLESIEKEKLREAAEKLSAEKVASAALAAA